MYYPYREKNHVKEKSMLMHLDSVLSKLKNRPYFQPVPRILFRPNLWLSMQLSFLEAKNGGALPMRILGSLPQHFGSFRTHMVLFWIFLLEKL